ncbi:hypothetical protein Aperf_G00000061781 [Anoplocephala perfoliata]
MLDNFIVTSPWSDGRSLIAKWTWSNGADLQYFEKANIYYYSPLDEGFERTELITQPITSFSLHNLRPETTYLVCIRVQHRRHPLKSILIRTPTTTTTTVFPTVRTPVNWHIRQPTNPVSPGNYVYDSRCIHATTQNWHLSALIGGILGVVFALFLGVLLLILLKRNRCVPGGSVGFGKQTTQRSLLGNSSTVRGSSKRRGRRSSSKQGSFHSSLWPSRSSNSRSEFSGHLREEDEDDDVDDDDEVIAEDDEEDTEIDTGGKSSVRSQIGIYGGSGGTTGSSNRHSSMSSSVDAREDSSSTALPYLPVNGIQVRSATRRSRDLKQPSIGCDSMKNISGVKVNVVAPTPDVIGAREDLSKISTAKIPDLSDQCATASPPANLPDPLLGSVIVTLRSPLVSSPPHLSKNSSNAGAEVEVQRECVSPVPLQEPQSVGLQTPVLIGMNPNQDECAWIESPMVEPSSHLITDIPGMVFEDDYHNSLSNPDYESTLSLSRANSGGSRESIVSSNYEYENYRCFASLEKLNEDGHQDHHKSGSSIYTEFIETI